MARPRKGPWRRGQKGRWYTIIGREIVKLADKRSLTPLSKVPRTRGALAKRTILTRIQVPRKSPDRLEKGFFCDFHFAVEMNG